MCVAVLSLPSSLHQGLSQHSSPAATDILSGSKEVHVRTHSENVSHLLSVILTSPL